VRGEWWKMLICVAGAEDVGKEEYGYCVHPAVGGEVAVRVGG